MREDIEAGWRYSINYGPDGQEDWANLITPEGEHVANVRTRHAVRIVAALTAASAVRPTGAVAWPGREFCEMAERNASQLVKWIKGDDDKQVVADAALAIRTLLAHPIPSYEDGVREADWQPDIDVDDGATTYRWWLQSGRSLSVTFTGAHAVMTYACADDPAASWGKTLELPAAALIEPGSGEAGR
jgi:hypothetical protein